MQRRLFRTPPHARLQTWRAPAWAPAPWWLRAWLLLMLAVGALAPATSRAAGFSESPVVAAVQAAGAAPALGPAELGLLVADGDALSEAVARAYQRARGIPEANVLRLALPGAGEVISAADFKLLKQLVDSRLPAGVQALLVTWAQPSRVQGPGCAMGLTSALALGYDARWCGGCQRTAASPYFNSRSSRPWTELRLRPAMMLGAASESQAQALIQRGLAAEGLMNQRGQPGGSGWLVRSSDGARSVRWPDFLRAATLPVPGVALHYLDNSAGTASDAVQAQPDLMFYFTGLGRVPLPAGNRFLPGAVADHLTSFGALSPATHGQMLATEWLAAGATGSYGMVEEPCNHPEKFPQASVLIQHYSRGATLVEAYWKSVAWPGQGVFFGDPLARPWAPRAP